MALTDNKPVRVRIKICGITRPEDALAAAQNGADAIGLVFYQASPRVVTIAKAIEITEKLPPFVSKVGLFVNAESDFIAEVLDKVAIDLLQFHGDEAPEQCGKHAKPFIKAIRMLDNVNLADMVKEYSAATALLLDTFIPDQPGGTGQTFDWHRIPTGLDKPIILAGGLTVDNVADAIRQVKPYAVDVSGGVESAKGIKSADKIAEFIQEVRHAKY